MRITNRMLSITASRQLAAGREELTRYQQMLATGHRLEKPSDDPAAAADILRYRGRIASLGQYRDNISAGQGRLQVADAALEMTEQWLREVQRIAVDFVSSGEDGDRQTATEAVRSIKDQVKDMANMRYGGRYIFAGHRSDQPPASGDPNVSWQGDAGDVRIIAGDDVLVSLNAEGGNPFRSADGTLVFDTLQNIVDGLETGDADLVRDQASQLEQAVVRVREIRGRYAQAHDRLQSAGDHARAEQAAVESLLGDTQNADINEAAVAFRLQQTAYEAVLSTTARVASQRLVDFLK